MRVMRAAMAEQQGQPFVVREVPIPELRDGHVLVRMVASGVCPTDVSLASGSWLMKRPRFPYIAGHEGCGFVAAVGAGVKSVREGDKVAVFWLNSTCGGCEYCTGGRENLCIKQESTGYTMGGTHADYCLVSADYVLPLPAGEYTDLAPIMCAGVTSYKAVKETGAKPGDTVVVVGVGGTGHLAIQYARARALNVIALDTEDSKLTLAKELGANLALNANQFPVNRVNRETNGGAHSVIVTTPNAKGFEQGYRMVRRGGSCVLVGVSEEALNFSSFHSVINEISIRGTVSGTRQDLAEALELSGSGAIRTIVETRTIEQVNEAVDQLNDRKVLGRLVLKMC